MVSGLINEIYHKFILWGYVRYGMRYGDELSYSYMGDCVGSIDGMFKHFENKYCNLGYIPVS